MASFWEAPQDRVQAQGLELDPVNLTGQLMRQLHNKAGRNSAHLAPEHKLFQAERLTVLDRQVLRKVVGESPDCKPI